MNNTERIEVKMNWGLRKLKCFLIMCFIIWQYAKAMDYTPVSAFEYMIYNDEVYIERFIGDQTKVSIPPTIEGKPVVIIDYHAFYNCSAVESINIPNSVTIIAMEAFASCHSLTSVIIPDSVTQMRISAFEDCTSLTSVIISESMTEIERHTFQGCTALTSVIIPESVTEIEGHAFQGCTSLVSVTIPESVTEIGGYVFYGCTSLESVTIPDSMTSIGPEAFGYCTSLKSIRIPKSLINIDPFTFISCSSLEDFIVDDNNEYYTSVNGVLFLKDMTKIVKYPEGKKDLSYVIPKGVTGILHNAFINCSTLTTIIIPSSIEYIDYWAFDNCNQLKTIIFAGNPPTFSSNAYPTPITFVVKQNMGWEEWEAPEGVTIEFRPESTPVSDFEYDIYGEYAVITKYKGNQRDVIIPAEIEGKPVEVIGWRAFAGKRGLLFVEIPSSVTEIDDSAFEGCSSLISITLPNSIELIGWYAFYNCTSLASINIPNQVTCIEDSTFLNCRSLASVTIPESVISIGDAAFANCSSLTSVTIPESVTWIAGNAFNSCTSLISITIPESVTSIGDAAFANCSSLTSVTIPESVTWIAGNAFNSCTSLISITIPESVTSISSDAFDACTALKSINIPKSIKYLPNFANCTSLEAIIVNNEHENYTSVDGIVFTKDMTEIVKYPAGKKDASYAIPEGVTRILSEAFSGCTYLKSITFPSTIKWIESFAFEYCSGLTEVTIPSSVENINWGTFANCASLTSVILSEGVKTIQYNAFENCSALTSIFIPASVESIESAFSGCTSLEAIVVAEGNENYASVDGVLFSKDMTEIVNYPEGKSDTVYSIPNGTTSISGSAFSNCATLTSIIIPSSMEYIGEGAFENCSNLVTIEIPPSVEYIGSGAFENCSSLVSIEFPPTVCLASCDFSGCSSLVSISLPDVGEIEEGDFSGCTSLVTVTLSASVSRIEGGAFSDCTSLASITVDDDNEDYTSVDGVLYSKDMTWLIKYPAQKQDEAYIIPASVTRIREKAFFGCKYLASITFNEALEEIESYAFSECTALTTVTLPYIYHGESGCGTFSGCTALTTVTIQSRSLDYIEICEKMFAGCTSLSTVILKEGLEQIEAKAFYGCTSLATITFPSTLSEIEYKAFAGCQSLTEMVFNGPPPEFDDDDSFDEDDDDEEYEEAFYPTPITFKVYPYRGWETFIPPEGVTVVFMEYDISREFEYEIVGNEAIITKYIGNQATVYIPAEIEGKPVTAIGDYAFANSSCVRFIHFQEGIETIGQGAFERCVNLEDAELPSSITVVGDRAFAGCSSLYTPEVLPSYSSVGGIAIGKEAFEHFGTGDWFYIPASVKSIGDRAFARCFGMEEVFIPSSVTEIGDGPFDMCISLENINVENDNTNYVSVDGVLFTKDMKRLVQYPAGRHGSSYEIPAGVTVIGAYAFAYCEYLSVTIPEGVTEIGEKAFMVCSIDSLEIPSTVTTIGDGALWPIGTITVAEGNESFVMQDGVLFTKDMKRLVQCPTGKQGASYTIPAGVTSIAPYAFACTGGISMIGTLMGNIILPDGIVEIGDHTFYMSSLQMIDIPSTVTVIGDLAFSSCNQLTSINVADNNAHYASQDGVLFTKDMTRLICYPAAKDGSHYDIPAGVTAIDQEAFADNRSLESITIPQTVVSIGDGAFSNCSQLSEIVFDGAMPSFGYIEYQEEITFSVPAGIGWEDWQAPEGVTVVIRKRQPQLLELTPGWNWVGFNVLPESRKVGDVLGTAGFTTNDVIQTNNGVSRFNGTGWLPSGFTVEPGRMYQIYVDKNMTVEIEGSPCETSSVELTAGWNWISNPTDTALAPSELVHGGSWTTGDRIQSSSAFVTYSGSGWIPSSGFLLEPGKGYQIRTANAGTLFFGEVVDDELYAVVDLSGGPDATHYPIRYSATGPDLNDDTCRTTELWLRKIPAGKFIMGSPADEAGRLDFGETQHEVTLTKDYYIGVFECTQRQWELVMGTRPSCFVNQDCYATRPVDSVSYNMIRGSSPTAGAGWPQYGHTVDADSFMGRMHAKTGLVFDLPTAAEWEYACRAGTTTTLNSGKNLTNPEGQDEAMDEVGRYWYNGGSGLSPTCDTTYATAKVGSYLPNTWGLFDMHGNIWEWVLDWNIADTSSPETDPKGPATGTERMGRGGSCMVPPHACRSAYWGGAQPHEQRGGDGFRIACHGN